MGAMPKKKHHIRLSAQERNELEAILRKGRASAVRQRHARILLLADTAGPEGGSSDSQIASAAYTSIPSVERGLERALERKDPERDYLRKLEGKGEAQLLALCCGPAPEGHARRMLSLLAGRLMELEVVDAICHETVRAVRKKTHASRGAKSSG